MSESPHTVLRLGAQAVDALPPRLRRSVRAALGRPGPRPVGLAELDDVLGPVTARMGSAPDDARAVLDGIVLALPSPPPADPFSEAHREWAWSVYRAVSGRNCYETDNEASPFDLAAARVNAPSRTRPDRWRWSAATLWPGVIFSPAWPSPSRRRTGHAASVEFGPGWGNPTCRSRCHGSRCHRRRAGREVLPAHRAPVRGPRTPQRGAGGHARVRL